MCAYRPANRAKGIGADAQTRDGEDITGERSDTTIAANRRATTAAAESRLNGRFAPASQLTQPPDARLSDCWCRTKAAVLAPLAGRCRRDLWAGVRRSLRQRRASRECEDAIGRRAWGSDLSPIWPLGGRSGGLPASGWAPPIVRVTAVAALSTFGLPTRAGDGLLRCAR